MKKINISYIDDLEKLRNLPQDEYYISLENNIDFEDIECYKEKENYYKFESSKTSFGFLPIDISDITFIFNGNNNAINNLYIRRGNEDNIGLFRKVNNNSIIKNLVLNNSSIYGRFIVGSFVGTMEGQIINCHVNGNLEGKMIVGGLVGESHNNCNFIYNTISNNITGSEFVGGIIGKAECITLIDNEVESNILFLQNYSKDTISEYTGHSFQVFLKEKEYRKKPLIMYKGLCGLVFK